MKLLNRTEAQMTKKKENDNLILSNIRLREYGKVITERLRTIKDSYEPEKVQRLQDFEDFCKDLMEKKAKILAELAGLQKLVTETKELYYGYVQRSDELLEKKYQIDEDNKKLDLRQIFISDLENKWREKQ